MTVQHTNESRSMLRRIAPLTVSVTAVAALAVVPAVATAAGPSAPASGSSSASGAASSSTSTAATPNAAPRPAAARPKSVGVKYQCMVLGKKVPVDLTWTLPANLVSVSSRPYVPAGRTLKSLAGGAVVGTLRIHLERTVINRLRYVDQSKVGGTLSSRIRFGSTTYKTAYKATQRPIKPASNGTQDLTVKHDFGSLQVIGKGAMLNAVPLMATNTATTNLMIPGFLWSNCSSSAGSSRRTMLTFRVRPARVTARKVGTTVRATVYDGNGALAQGSIVESIRGAGRTVRSTLTLSKGVASKSWGATMKKYGMKSAKVTISYAGRSGSLTIRR